MAYYDMGKLSLSGSTITYRPLRSAPLLEPSLQNPNQLIQPLNPHPRMLMRLQSRIILIRQQHRRRAGAVTGRHIVDGIAHLFLFE